MRLHLDAFTAAVRANLSPAVAAALPDAARAMFGSELPEEIPDRQAGELILRAVLQRPDWSAPTLDLLALHVPLQMPLELPPADVSEHPLFGSWVDQTFADALAAPIIAGARALDITPGAPNWGPIQLVDVEGATFAYVSLTFGDLSVVARYGEALADMPMVRSLMLSGTALYGVGHDARRASTVGSMPPPPAGGLEVLGPLKSAASGSLH